MSNLKAGAAKTIAEEWAARDARNRAYWAERPELVQLADHLRFIDERLLSADCVEARELGYARRYIVRRLAVLGAASAPEAAR